MLTSIHYIEEYFTFVFLDCARYNENFVKSRFCSIDFIVSLTELKKIVIPRTLLYRASLNRVSNVLGLLFLFRCLWATTLRQF